MPPGIPFFMTRVVAVATATLTIDILSVLKGEDPHGTVPLG